MLLLSFVCFSVIFNLKKVSPHLLRMVLFCVAWAGIKPSLVMMFWHLWCCCLYFLYMGLQACTAMMVYIMLGLEPRVHARQALYQLRHTHSSLTFFKFSFFFIFSPQYPPSLYQKSVLLCNLKKIFFFYFLTLDIKYLKGRKLLS